MGIKISIALAMMLLNQLSIKPTEREYLAHFKQPQDLEVIKKAKLESNIIKAKLRLEQEQLLEHQESSITREIDTNFEALAKATWRLETGNGTSRLWLTQNNAGGIKCGRTYCSYPTEQAGLQALKTLLYRYVEKYGYDLEAIRSVYSESNDTDLFRQIYIEEGGH